MQLPSTTSSRALLTAALLTLGASHASAQVGAEQKISATDGGFSGALDPFDLFGWSVAPLGDLDGDGVGDLAAGSFLDDDGAPDTGAVWILFLHEDGTVKSHSKISATEGGFAGALDSGDFFGTSIAPLDDLDGDGVVDIAVGAYYDDDGGPDQGAVWILFLETDGTVKSHSKISETEGGLGVSLEPLDWFGWAMTNVGDLDGDGVVDLAVSADGDDGPGLPGDDVGAVYVLFLKPDGTVKATSKFGPGVGGFGGVLFPSAYFGSALANLGDLDGDGVTDLAVGADGDDVPVPDAGSAWVVFMKPDGTVKAETRIGSGENGFMSPLAPFDQFGRSATAADLDGDGVSELIVAADRDDKDGADQGALYVLALMPDGTVAMEEKIAPGLGGFVGPLADGDHFGNAVCALGDIDKDGHVDFAVGAEGSDDGGPEQGAVWVLFLGPPEPLAYCFGDACPCGNDDGTGGCANSTGKGAALVVSDGSTSVTEDDLVLTVRRMPSSKPGVFLVGGAAGETPFKDGKLCIASGGIGIKRFDAKKSSASGVMSEGPGIAAAKPAIVVPGATLYFQAWYRDLQGPCGKGTNLSNAMSVTFVP